MGVDVERGKYAPTAKGSDETPHNSMNSAIDTPKKHQNPGQLLTQNAVGYHCEELGLGRIEFSYFRAVIAAV